MTSPARAPRAVRQVTHAGVTVTVITGSRLVHWLRRLSPQTGALVLGRTIRFSRSVRAYLDGAVLEADRRARVQAFAVLLAHEWAHVQQFSRLGWTFLPRWGAQVLAGLWRELTATVRRDQWWQAPFAVLTRCAKFPKRARAAYKTAPLEVEADTFAALNWRSFQGIVEDLP